MGNGDCARGPISRKVIAGLEKELNRKIINFASLKFGAERAAELDREVISDDGMRELDPLHAVYVFAQNKMSVLLESITRLPPCAKLVDKYCSAEDEYQPSGPPMSPLTASYFFCWSVFDSRVGDETLGTVAIALCRRLGMQAGTIRLFEIMQASRMGLYVHEGIKDSRILLREFVTGKLCRCIVPAGYRGRPGELWYVRVLPDPLDATPSACSLVFTTPYVICKWASGKVEPADSTVWQAFLDRTIPKTGIKDACEAYERLMKFGLSWDYWNEYVFQAYLNHTPNMILLTGFPDDALSRPHSRTNMAFDLLDRRRKDKE